MNTAKQNSKIIKYFPTLFFLLLFLSPFSARAQEKIVSVVVAGNQRIEKSIIFSQIFIKPGAVYDRAKVSQDVVRIYRLGFFDNVEVEKSSSSEGLELVYQVTERPPVDEILIEGNEKVSQDKIREAISVKTNVPADNNQIAISKEKIKELYIKEGYSSAIIETEFRKRDASRQLVFKIAESKGSVVREVRFEGNEIFSDAKLKRIIKTKKKGALSFITGSGKYREDVVERDVALITYNYLNEGYLRVRVSQPKVEYSEEKKGLILTFNIDEGEKYKINNIDISGDILTSKEELLKSMHTTAGKFYSQKVIEEDLAKLSEIYGNQGYAFANIVPQPDIHDDIKTVDLNIAVEKGQRVYVEKINITGNTITRDKVIRREIKVKENSLYNEGLLKLSKRKLEQLGFFESVEVSTPRGSADDRLVLNVNVKEKPTGTFNLGLGFSSVDSFMLTGSVSKNNFMGLGISGSLNAEVSKRRQQFSFQYTDPYFFDSNWIFSTTGYRISTSYEDFRRKSFGGELNFGRRLFDFTSISLGYRIEDVKLDDFDLIVPEFFKKNADGLTSSLVFQLRRDTRNNPLVTTQGTYNSVDVEYAGNGIGGDNNFFRVSGNSRYYLPLWGNSVFKANGRIGYIQSLDDKPVPLFERFFTGGINSLRGFDFRTVGPSLTIPNGVTGKDEEFIYGGNKLLLFNLEYEFPIYDAAGFRGVVFVDAGNAYAENENLNPLKMRSNFGAGFRWISPFGPLRFEWGFPFKRKPGEKSNVFNFSIGTFF